MSNTITIELCEEDRKRLDSLFCIAAELTGAIKALNTPVIMEAKNVAPAEEPTAPQEAPNLEVVKSDHPVDAVPPHAEPQDVAPAEEAKPTVTLEQIRQKITVLLAAGGKTKEAVREIVKSYAPNVTGLKDHEAKWPEIWDKLTALEG